MADYLKTDIKAGAVIVFCVALLVAFVFYLGGFKKFESTYRIRLLADSAYGVGISSIVTYSGVNVGEVKSLRVLSEEEMKAELEQLNVSGLFAEDIRVEMILQVSENAILKQDSEAEIVGSGLVGDQIVNLTPGSFESALLTRGAPMVGVTLTGLGKLQKGIGEVNFEVLIPNVRKIIMNLTEASDRIKETTRRVDELLGDLDRKDQISGMLDRTEHILDELDNIVSGSSEDIRSAAANFKQATEDLKNELGPILHSVRSAADNIDEILVENKEDINEIMAEFKETAVNFNEFSLKVKKYPWTLIRKTSVDKQDENLFPETAKIKIVEPEKKQKLFFFF